MQKKRINLVLSKFGMFDLSFWFNIGKIFFDDLSVRFMSEEDAHNIYIFDGGSDISPSIYKEDNLYSFTNPVRDEYETLMFKEAQKENAHIIGICRGHQLINALLGGSLYQDIHRQGLPAHPGSHICEVSAFKNIFGESHLTNSMHHQGVKILGNNMQTIMTWGGIPEATISEDLRIRTVQFHPEMSRDVKVLGFLFSSI